MNSYLDVPVDRYGTIRVEVEPYRKVDKPPQEPSMNQTVVAPGSGFEDLGLRDTAKKVVTVLAETAPRAFEEIAETIKTIAYGFCENIIKLEKAVRPDEVEVEFGLALKTEGDIVVAKAGGEANFKVKFVWKAKAIAQEFENVD